MGDMPLYRKIFMILAQEDTGFGTGKEPSGHIKIEARDGKGEMSLSVQNLKEIKGEYRVYIIKCGFDKAVPVLAGVIKPQNEKSQLKWQFNPQNVGNTGLSVDDFNVAAIITDGASNEGIVCPLAAYREEKIPWREKFKNALSPVNKDSKSDEGDYKKTEAIKEKVPEKIQDKTPEPQKSEPSTLNSKSGITESKQDEISMDEPVRPVETVQNEGLSSDNIQIENKIENNKTDIIEEQDYVDVQCFHEESELGPTDEKIRNEGSNDYPDEKNLELNFHLYSRMKDMTFEDIECDVSRFKGELDKYFEVYSPFRRKRMDYRWWKLQSPSLLNSILYISRIRTPFIFNPRVLIAHSKYRHLLVGIYEDKQRKKEYIVFGVPATYRVDDKPFSVFCRWAQAEGIRPRHGAFGYWLLYIDPRTGRLV